MQPDTEEPDVEMINPDDIAGKGVQTVDTPEDVEPTDTPDDEHQGDTFPRSYVEKLRKESARYREQARSADVYAQRLHTELVRATGRLADPSDLPFDPSHLDDPDAMAAAVEDLLARKPHLASRRPLGDIGQGATSSTTTVDLAGMLRQRAV